MSRKQVKTLGIDPSSTSTGYALVVDDELVLHGKLKMKADDSKSFFELFTLIDRLLEEHEVDHVYMETQHQRGNAGVQSLIKMIRPTGAVMTAAGKWGHPVELVQPSSWRKVFHQKFEPGYKGTRKKEDTYRVVTESIVALKSFNSSNDISDAIGIAWAGHLMKKGDGET